MQIKILTLVSLWTVISGVVALKYGCTEQSALQLLKNPAYNFSLKLLRRVAEDTDGHFVFSPLATWMQLIALSEQSQGTTFREIWRVTRHQRNRCFQRKLLRILNKLDRSLNSEGTRSSLMVVDQYMDVKPRFKRQLEKLYGIKLLVLDFDDPEYSVEQVNSVVREKTDGVIKEILYYDDFFSSELLISDASYFKNEWRTPFNVADTKIQQFFTSDVQAEYVSMMNQVGKFNIIDFPRIKSTVLELPCAINRVSMLIFLPHAKVWPGNLFFDLQNMTLATVFNMFKKEQPKTVNVTMPSFRIQSEVDNIPELLMDMGIKRIFYPKTADLKGISSFSAIHASLMTQIAHIEVTEKGVDAGTVAGQLIRNNNDTVDFLANRPFSYMLVDRPTQFILYAGTYSRPTVI